MDNEEKFDELRKLNRNLERLLDIAPGLVEGLRGISKSAGTLRRELHIFNQILISVSQKAGQAGMVKTVLESLAEYFQPPRRRRRGRDD